MTRFYIKDTEEFDRACRLLDKREKHPALSGVIRKTAAC